MNFLLKIIMLVPILIIFGCQAELPDGYPPHPGSAGDDILLGIDSDDDGVRDDWKIEIFYKYPEPEQQALREALELGAIWTNEIIIATQEPDADLRKEKIFEIRKLSSELIECVGNPARDLYPDNPSKKMDIYIESGNFIEEFFNTAERREAYSIYNKTLSGKVGHGFRGELRCDQVETWKEIKARREND